MDDDYTTVTKKPLKLAIEKDKEKKGKTKIKKRQEYIVGVSGEAKVLAPTTTKAEEAFRRKREKIAEERILKKATKTHKQRVEEFNKHLDSLSEHYDIPKVSWTK